MSEKNLWKLFNGRVEGHYEWDSFRIENCSNQGIPDSIVAFTKYGLRLSLFIELKDWSNKKRHPLLPEQKNFIESFGGLVMMAMPNDTIVFIYDIDMEPLTIGDISWVRRGVALSRFPSLPLDFKPEQAIDIMAEAHSCFINKNVSQSRAILK